MEQVKILSNFFSAIERNGKIGATHIGIFAALLQFRALNGNRNPMFVFSYEVMKLAKVSSPATYRKCIRDLSESGFILFTPSFKRNQGSKVYFP